MRLFFGLMFACGAVVHIVLVTMMPEVYSSFADSSPIPWITRIWQVVTVPNVEYFIPLLAAFEMAAGVLILGRGWRARFGLTAAIAFHVALAVLGPWPYAIPAAVVLLVMRHFDFGPGLGRVYVHHTRTFARAA